MPCGSLTRPSRARNDTSHLLMILFLREVRDLLARRGRGAGTPCLHGWSVVAGRHVNDINGYLKSLLGEEMHRGRSIGYAVGRRWSGRT
jgi:hypothetical protein